MEETKTPFAFGNCRVCGIRFTVDESGNKTFYWSNNNKEASSDQVASKICRNIKRTDVSADLCVNKTGKYVPGLGWGESLEEQAIEAWYEDFKGELKDGK